jgi:hypothetical protein
MVTSVGSELTQEGEAPDRVEFHDLPARLAGSLGSANVRYVRQPMEPGLTMMRNSRNEVIDHVHLTALGHPLVDVVPRTSGI